MNLDPAFVELLVQRATAGLDAAGHRALRQETARAGLADLGPDGALGFALASASADLGFTAETSTAEHMPTPLRVRISEEARTEVSRLGRPRRTMPSEPTSSLQGSRFLAWSGMAAAMVPLGPAPRTSVHGRRGDPDVCRPRCQAQSAQRHPRLAVAWLR